jgi:hypothetical protein
MYKTRLWRRDRDSLRGKITKFLILSEMSVNNILGKTYRFDCLSLSFYSFP